MRMVVARGKSLLRQIVGRIKDYMGAAYLGVAIFLMTTAIYFSVETEEVGLSFFAMGLGVVNLIVAVIFTRREEQQNQKKDTATLNVLVSIAEKLGVDTGSLEQTLKKFGYEKVKHGSRDSK